MGAGIEALGTVSGVEEEGLVALHEAELVAEAFDLARGGCERRADHG